MKKLLTICISAVCLIFTLLSCDNSNDISDSVQEKNKAALETARAQNKKEACVNIQSGTIVDDNGAIITTGFNDIGFNYQAKIYSGEIEPIDYPGWFLEWRWNEAYLSTQDCDGDGLLDIANGQESYRGTGAWTTTKWTKEYINSEGEQCQITQFTKYVAVSLDAYVEGGMYYHADGTAIGQVVNEDAEGFEDFAMVQFIWNDPCQGIEGPAYKAPGPVGLGNR